MDYDHDEIKLKPTESLRMKREQILDNYQISELIEFDSNFCKHENVVSLCTTMYVLLTFIRVGRGSGAEKQ